MRKGLCFAPALAAALLAACSTSPVSELNARPAQPDHVFAYQTASGAHGDITITRDSGMMGAGCLLSVFVNGTEAAKLGTSEKVTLQLAPGRWNLGTGYTATICGGASSRRAVQVVVEAGDHLHYRLATTQDDLSIVATD